jgi:hypothetical protein
VENLCFGNRHSTTPWDRSNSRHDAGFHDKDVRVRDEDGKGENQSRSADFTNLNSGNQQSAGEDEYLPTGNNIRDSVRPTV